MKKIIYPAKYTDKFGSVKTEIINDGEELSITIRGVEFKDTDFDLLMPVTGTPSEKLKNFTLNNFKELCDFKLECDIPILIGKNTDLITGTLKMEFVLGKPTPKGNPDREDLKLELVFNNKKIESGGKSGWFEDEMLDIQKKLPLGYFLKCCFGCLYSDYSVAGHGLFGNMMCYRNTKEEYLAVKNKSEYMEIMKKVTEDVQEIHLCLEFKKRVSGTGYRG